MDQFKCFGCFKKNLIISKNLYDAASRGCVECVRRLIIEDKKNVDGKEYWVNLHHDNTPLHLASRHGNSDCIKELLKHGAHINAYNPDHWTPLIYAAVYGHSKCIETLLIKGASVGMTSINNETALHWSIIKGYMDCATILIIGGASITWESVGGRSAISFSTNNKKYHDSIETANKARSKALPFRFIIRTRLISNAILSSPTDVTNMIAEYDNDFNDFDYATFVEAKKLQRQMVLM